MRQGKYKYVNGQFVHESASKRWALEGLVLDAAVVAVAVVVYLAMAAVVGWVVFYYFYQE